jgi:hypothetical protein
MVVREIDNGTAMSADWKVWREDVRLATNAKVLSIGETVDTAELAAYITGTEYPTWPANPDQPPIAVDVDSVVGGDTLIVDGVTSGTILSGSTIAGSAGNDALVF